MNQDVGRTMPLRDERERGERVAAAVLVLAALILVAGVVMYLVLP